MPEASTYQIESYNGTDITFRGDAWVSATEMAKPFKKRTNDFLRLASTQAFISALKTDNPVAGNPVTVVQGGSIQGTWMHPDLALEFARWLSPEFAVWTNRTIRRLMSGLYGNAEEAEITEGKNGVLYLDDGQPHMVAVGVAEADQLLRQLYRDGKRAWSHWATLTNDRGEFTCLMRRRINPVDEAKIASRYALPAPSKKPKGGRPPIKKFKKGDLIDALRRLGEVRLSRENEPLVAAEMGCSASTMWRLWRDVRDDILRV